MHRSALLVGDQQHEVWAAKPIALRTLLGIDCGHLGQGSVTGHSWAHCGCETTDLRRCAAEAPAVSGCVHLAS